MPDATKTPYEYTRSTCSLNQRVRSFVGLVTSAGTGEYFPPLQFTCRNCGCGDRCGFAIYRPFGEYRRLNRTVTCMVLNDNDRRTSSQCNVLLTATAGSDVVQSGRPIFDDFFQHLWQYIGNNTANVVFHMIKRLWLIRIDQ
ncbi:hypothetical protein TNCV_909901 [Trichonephila clavipes]|nr:hypothetical protein TNCV_909901 [Trichonephila clavipes]